jgi:hypothetical protein
MLIAILFWVPWRDPTSHGSARLMAGGVIPNGFRSGGRSLKGSTSILQVATACGVILYLGGHNAIVGSSWFLNLPELSSVE